MVCHSPGIARGGPGWTQAKPAVFMQLWGSISALGIFFGPFPTRACFCPHLTKQFGVPSRRV